METQEENELFQVALEYAIDHSTERAVQSRIAGRAGISDSYVGQLARGTKHGKRRTHIKIAKACGFRDEREFYNIGRAVLRGELPPLPMNAQEPQQEPDATPPDPALKHLNDLLQAILEHGTEDQKQLVILAIEGAARLGDLGTKYPKQRKDPPEPQSRPAPLRGGSKRKAM